MNTIELTKEDEQKLLEYVKDDKLEFIAVLESILEESDTKLKFSTNMLNRLFLEYEYNGFDDVNEYKAQVYKLISINFSVPNIDFSNFKYDNLIINQDTIDFFKSNNIVIDLDGIYKKELVNFVFESCIFKGSFDGFILNNVKFKDNKDIIGNCIKINPQKIRNKEMINCSFEDVAFTGSFDNCDIRNIKISNCKSAKINPQKLKCKDLSNCIFEDVEFTGNFDECNVKGIKIYNNQGVVINPQRIINKDFTNVYIDGAKFTGSIDNCNITNITIKNTTGVFANARNFNFCNFKENNRIEVMTLYIDNDADFEAVYENKDVYLRSPDVIICKPKYVKYLKENKYYQHADFEIIKDKYDDKLRDFIKELINKKLKGEEEEISIKVKKKSIFDKFKK